MNTLECDTWDDYKAFVSRLFAAPIHDDHFFRGQTDATWALTSTLERCMAKTKASLPQTELEDRLLKEFRHLMIDLEVNNPPEGDALSLLARHHGVPSAWVDWTTSPYVAAYFALSGTSDASHAAVWWLPRSWVPDNVALNDLILDPELIRFNPRALRQRGVFMRPPTADPDLTAFDDALTKIVIRRDVAPVALLELDAMTINAANLFADLDGAARTAFDRIMLRH